MHRPSPLIARADYRQRPVARTAIPCVLMALCATTLTLAGVDALAAPAAAPSGPIELTQAKALNGNITGDAAGFPITIVAPGSYRLMSNLTVPDTVTTAIEIAANDVTLDLNGFTIAGPQSCGTYGAPTCQFGSGDGIAITGPNGRFSNIAIANGTVRGFGRHGLFDGSGTRLGVIVDRVRAFDNGGDGFALTGALIVHSVAMRNGMNGFGLNGGDVQSSVAWSNGNWGLYGTGITTFGGNNFNGNAWGQAYPGLKQTSGNLCGITLCP